MRALFLGLIGERAKRAKNVLSCGLRTNPIHRGNRLAFVNAAVALEDEAILVSSTALCPTMNAYENLAAAAEVIALALTQRQIRTPAPLLLKSFGELCDSWS